MSDEYHRASNSTPTYDLLAGHLGRLNSDQEKAFAIFKTNLEAAKLYTPSSGSTKASHDDPTLLYVLLLAALHYYSNASTIGGFSVPGGLTRSRLKNSSQTPKPGASSTT